MSHKVPPQRHQDLFALPHLSAINPDVPARRIDVSTYRRHRKHALLILLHTSLLANRQKINKPWKPERCCIVNVNPSWVDCWSLTYPVRGKKTLKYWKYSQSELNSTIYSGLYLYPFFHNLSHHICKLECSLLEFHVVDQHKLEIVKKNDTYLT